MSHKKPTAQILDKNDLKAFILDKEAFAGFALSEREQFVVKAHIINGFTFKHIGAIGGGVSDTMANRVYLRALKKIRKRLLELLKSSGSQPIAASNEIYIAGDGEVCYGIRPSDQSLLAVGWKKVG